MFPCHWSSLFSALQETSTKLFLSSTENHWLIRIITIWSLFLDSTSFLMIFFANQHLSSSDLSGHHIYGIYRRQPHLTIRNILTTFHNVSVHILYNHFHGPYFNNVHQLWDKACCRTRFQNPPAALCMSLSVIVTLSHMRYGPPPALSSFSGFRSFCLNFKSLFDSYYGSSHS